MNIIELMHMKADEAAARGDYARADELQKTADYDEYRVCMERTEMHEFDADLEMRLLNLGVPRLGRIIAQRKRILA